ncbi:MAG: hypothetical protein H0X27_00005 [Caulobacteraceae bacterium]|nr:hypothetical protein [Caulobacteraceae bacterium]
MPQVQANLTDADLQDLVEIAKRRGVDANTALQQAIATEKLILDNVQDGDDLLIKKPNNTVSKVVFSK